MQQIIHGAIRLGPIEKELRKLKADNVFYYMLEVHFQNRSFCNAQICIDRLLIVVLFRLKPCVSVYV